MFSGGVAAGIAVMHVPNIAGELVLQNHDMARSNGRHARCRGRARETAPVGREIQFGNDTTEFVQRRLAAAERVRASGRTSADNLFADLHARDRGHGVQVVVPISQMMMPMMMAPIMMTRMSFGSSNRSKQQTRNSNNNFSHCGRLREFMKIPLPQAV